MNSRTQKDQIKAYQIDKKVISKLILLNLHQITVALSISPTFLALNIATKSNPNRTLLYSLGTNLFYEELSSRRRSIFLLEGWSPSCCGIWNNFCRGHFESAPCWATSHKDCMFCRLVIPNGGKTRLRRAGLDYAGPKPAGGEPYLKKDYPSKVTPHLLFYRTHTTSSMPTFMETLEQ